MDFEIEIVDAYEIADRKAQQGKLFNKKEARRMGWSVHVYIPIYDMDIRGILARKLSNGWFIQMPHTCNFDKETKKWVMFPSLSFTSVETKEKFISELNTKFVDFIKEKLLEEGEAQEKKKIDWMERQKKVEEKLKRSSDKRNQSGKYKTNNTRNFKGKK